jgi:hypothetical protein
VRIQEYARLAIGKHQVVDMRPYFSGPGTGRILIGGSASPEGDCGCLWTFMPPQGDIPSMAVTILCDKHELGQLLAEERARLEKAWALMGP